MTALDVSLFDWRAGTPSGGILASAGDAIQAPCVTTEATLTMMLWALNAVGSSKPWVGPRVGLVSGGARSGSPRRICCSHGFPSSVTLMVPPCVRNQKHVPPVHRREKRPAPRRDPVVGEVDFAIWRPVVQRPQKTPEILT